MQSKVFAAALPEDNLFDPPCASLGGVPAGVHSPVIDDGVYAHLGALKAGMHTLHIHAENPSAGFVLEVTYNLNVTRVWPCVGTLPTCDGELKFDGGTGKYTGITGNSKFKATVIGQTQAGFSLISGEWKLP